MIEINLLPENLRAKKEIDAGLGQIMHFVKIGVAVLAGIHLLLFFVSLAYNYVGLRLAKNRARITWQDADTAGLQKEFSAIQNRAKVITDLTKEKSEWAERLDRLSSVLPNGVWFNSIQAEKGLLNIRGSVVSLKGDEVEILHIFLDNLKKDAFFSARLKNIDVVSIDRSNLFGVEVADFSIKGLFSQ